jgi:hypothetical protein
MTIQRTYRCPGNGKRPSHQFSYLHHPSVEADPLPRYCPHCGFDSEGDDMEPAVTSPHIGLPIRNTVDTLHRDMEAGAEFRAQMAQEQFGLDTADANAMKIGDMKDGLRAGDTSDVPVNNDITRVMAAAPPGMFGFQGDQGVGYSGTVATGPFPNMGARTQKAVREAHVVNTADPRHVGTKTSYQPAEETKSPNYRVRVR